MIKDVVREHHWAPDIISALFVDNKGPDGLVYWSNDVRDVYKKTKPKKTK